MTPQAGDIHSPQARAAALKPLDPALANALCGRARTSTAPAQQRLFSPGSPCGQFLVLLDGVVRVQAMSPAGREVLLYRLHAGQSCVMTTSCLLGGCHYAAEGIAETPIRFATLPARDFEQMLAASRDFRMFVFSSLGTRLAELMGRVEEVALERIDTRLARFLLRYPLSADGLIGCTHQDIAADLGSVREVISRQLKGFEQNGWVSLRRGRIAITDRAALEALLQRSVT